jgi:hypothetical protein
MKQSSARNTKLDTGMCEIRENIFTLPATQIFAQNLASLSYVAHISLDSRSCSGGSGKINVEISHFSFAVKSC